MHHYFEAITNTSGDSLVGYFARVIDPASQNTIVLSSDDNGTPIEVVSGVDNMAKTDAFGNLDFYVAPGTYHLDIYAPNSTSFIMRVSNVAMNSSKGDKGDPGDIGETGPASSTYTTLATLKSAPVSNGSYVFAPASGSEAGIPAATFYYRAGSFSSRPDGPGFIKLTGVTAGALFAARDTAIVPNIDTTQDAGAALQAAIDAAVPGDVIRLPRATYAMTVAPIIKPGITLDLNGAAFTLNLSGVDDPGVRLRSGASLLLNGGSITVNSIGNPSQQTQAHACITIGPAYGASASIASLSPDEGVTGVRIIGPGVLTTNKLATDNGTAVGGVAIAIMGGSSYGLIDNITVPDSDRMFGVVHADWGTVGPIASDNIANSRAAFDAGTAYTTHPHNWTVRKIKAGKLSRPTVGTDTGSHGTRWSGCYNILVEDCAFAATTYATVRHTAGDLGFEFAREEDKRMAYQNVVFRDISCPDTGVAGNLIYSDTLADNIQRAVAEIGYSPIIDPLAVTNMTMERVTGRAGSGVGPNGIGIRVIQQSGGTFADNGSVGHYIGHLAGEQAVGVTFLRPRATLCQMEGVLIADATQVAPMRCTARGAISYFNNRAGGNKANVAIGRSVDCTIDGGVIGILSNESARYGVFIDTFTNGCQRANIIGTPTINGHASGGAAFLVSSDDGWGALRLFQGGAIYGAGVTQRWLGLSIVPVAIDSSGTVDRTSYKSPRGKLSADTTPPATFPGKQGDRIEFNDPTASLSKSVCNTTGTPGTWVASA